VSQNAVIIGGGPAGHEAAIRLAKSGIRVTLIESTAIGGTCLNAGCIPTKAYLHKAKLAKTLKKLKIDLASISSLQLRDIQSTTFRTINRLSLAMEKSAQNEGVTVLRDTVISIDEDSVVTASGISLPYNFGILATGTSPWIPPAFKAIENNPNVFTNETIFSLTTLPSNITILGGGAIGVEFAFIFSALGSSVTLIEAAPSILGMIEPDLSSEIKRQLKLSRVIVLDGAAVTAADKTGTLTLSNGQTLAPETLLIATGRKPRLPVATPLFELTPKGYVETDNTYKTSHPKWYAIGDINGRSLLAHAANDQAEQLAVYLSKGTIPLDKPIPSVVYSLPAVASIGIRSSEKPDGAFITDLSYNILGKAQVEEAGDGWVRLIHQNDVLLGFHGFGVAIEDLVPLMQLAIQEKMSLKTLASMVAPHPSYGEILKMAIERAIQE
jgi:dihydrolipoamide dehydrogenase